MMKQALVLCFIALVFSIKYQDRQTIVKRDGVPDNSGWRVLRKALPEEKVTFTISLQQRNLAQLEERFWANSDPHSPVYARHMTHQEITDLTAPSQEVQLMVIAWIKRVASSLPQSNLMKMENQQDAIVITSTVLLAEKLFETELHLFGNERNKMAAIKHMGELSVPSTIASHITLVTGITELPPISIQTEKKAKRQTGNNLCNNPYTIKNLYNVPQDLYITKNASASIYAQATAGQVEGFGLGSIEDYQKSLDLPQNPITCILGNYATDYSPNDDDGEANLDTEMVTGIAPNVYTCFYIMNPTSGWMYEFTRTVFSTPNAPPIVSMSYAWNENDQCDDANNGGGLGNCSALHIPNSKAYVNITNIQFQKLGLLGHTMLSSSGDGGIAGGHGSINSCATQGPLFPAGSPYVTAVGATSIEVSTSDDQVFDWTKDAKAPVICTDSFYGCNCSTSTNEQPALSVNTASFDTGGGFSMYTPQPKYQQAAVQAYLKSGVQLPPAKYFNGNNRGYPDVAAVGENICLLDPSSGCNFSGGTSASSPIWAGLVAHLNNDRLVAGKTLLGFINPIIYDMFDKGPQTYYSNGFSSGNNNGGCPESMGFNAQANQWTPLTGCGSPKFDQIRKYVAALP